MPKHSSFKGGSKKGRQRSHNLATKKYYHTFVKAVIKHGKWRGKAKTLSDARSK